VTIIGVVKPRVPVVEFTMTSFPVSSGVVPLVMTPPYTARTAYVIVTGGALMLVAETGDVQAGATVDAPAAWVSEMVRTWPEATLGGVGAYRTVTVTVATVVRDAFQALVRTSDTTIVG
jgi:hypothetical protein